MAKAPWDKYATPSKKTGWATKKTTRAAKPGKSPRQKLLEAIDNQIANLGKDIGKKAWFKAHPDGDVVKGQVRYGTQPIILTGDVTYIELPESMLGQFFKDIRAAVDAGKFDAQLDDISERMSARRRK